MKESLKVPSELVQDILEGRCVAFVGAGFSAGAVPTWEKLLESIARLPNAKASEQATPLLKVKTAFDYGAVGQILRERFPSKRDFEAKVQGVIRESFDETKLGDRVKHLSEIPFDAILTTNYDPALPGVRPSPEIYQELLRRPRRWWDREQWNQGADEALKPHNVIKLHGDANGNPDDNPIVIGTADYRHLVHEDPFYAPFLRAILATKTVLFLGVSFTDAYLNELRSEIVGMFSPKRGRGPDSAPLAYAVLPDRNGEWEDYFLRHEGIRLLGYSTGESGQDHSGFDEWLHAIHEATAPARRLARLLKGKKVVWLDRKPDNNKHGRKVLEKAGCDVKPLAEPNQLTQEHFRADLLITNFGYRSEGSSVAFDVLERLRKEASGPRPPVIVFASGDEATRNRLEVLRRGAFEYASRWSELFGLIERLFGREVGY